jgi:hypothetical protein
VQHIRKQALRSILILTGVRITKVWHAEFQFYILAEQILTPYEKAPILFSKRNSVFGNHMRNLVVRTYRLRSGTLIDTIKKTLLSIERRDFVATGRAAGI